MPHKSKRDFLLPGSTVITLFDSYLATLADGSYVLQAMFENGEVTERFIIDTASKGQGGRSGSTSSTLVNTGDTASSSVILGSLSIIALAAGVLVIAHKKLTKLR